MAIHPTYDEQEKIVQLRTLISITKAGVDARNPDTHQAVKDAERMLDEYERELAAGVSDDE